MQSRVSRTHVGIFIALVLAMAGLLWAVEANRAPNNLAFAAVGTTGDTGDTGDTGTTGDTGDTLVPPPPPPKTTNLKITKFAKKKKNGTAVIVGQVNKPGVLTVYSKDIKKKSKKKKAAGKYKVSVVAKGKKKKVLKKKGKVTVRFKLKFNPNQGKTVIKSRKITLVKKTK